MGLCRITVCIAVASALPFGSGCGSSTDTSSALTASESVSEIGGSVIGGAVNFSSSTASATSAHEDTATTASTATSASSVCPSLAHAKCSGSIIKLTYNGCTNANDLGEKWTGVEEYLFTSGDCTNTPELKSVTFTRSYPSGMSQTDSTERTITSDTVSTSGWQTPIAGGGTNFVIDPATSTRSIQVNGIHMVATQQLQKGEIKQNVTVWDRTFSASDPLVFNELNQVISSGSLTVQHNVKKYTATVQITAPLQFQAGTCNPVSGVLTSTWTGSQSGTETLTYLGNDQADLMDSSGNHSTVTLAHCL